MQRKDVQFSIALNTAWRSVLMCRGELPRLWPAFRGKEPHPRTSRCESHESGSGTIIALSRRAKEFQEHKQMNAFLVLVILLFVCAAAYGQSVARANRPGTMDTLIAESKIETKATDEYTLAARSINALKRLDNEVLVYRSLGEFEANGKLARVSFAAFTDELGKVTAEVEPILSRLPQSRLKTEISNALDSYRDGAFWWQKIDQPRVVHVSALTATDTGRAPSDTVFQSTIPYTVAIHWRQAGRYLKSAEKMMDGTKK